LSVRLLASLMVAYASTFTQKPMPAAMKKMVGWR